MRHALDIAKPEGTEFYFTLCQMNDKINIYKKVFYGREPKYETNFTEKKKK